MPIATCGRAWFNKSVRNSKHQEWLMRTTEIVKKSYMEECISFEMGEIQKNFRVVTAFSRPLYGESADCFSGGH